jgi:hypothetical protein
MRTHSQQQPTRRSNRLGLTPVELAIGLSILAVLAPFSGQDGVVVAADAGRPNVQRMDAYAPAGCGFTNTDAAAVPTVAVFSTVVTSGC